MRVTAKLFAMPGRGEFYEQGIDMPDTAMPQGIGDFSVRSVKALRHFWPNANVSDPVFAKGSSTTVVISGVNWGVTWEKDSAYHARLEFEQRLHNCEDGVNQELFRRAAEWQATKEVCV